MDNETDERQDGFVASLDQFFTSIEPVLKEANTIEAAEDLLTNLETTDENFHRYEFVRKLRARIDKILGPLIDMKLESLSGESDSNTLLSQVADEIQTSQEFISLQQSVLADTKEAVNVLVQKYANPLQRGASDFDFSDHKTKMHTVKDSLDLSDDQESLSSSIGQVGYMFMSQEKSGKIAENLHPLKPVQVKSEALTSLAQVPQSDVITSEHWPAIRKGLLAALADDDDHLSEKSLKFHARMFLCSTSHATREIYTCLAEHLWHCFNNKPDMMVKIEQGINVQTKNNTRLIKRFRLLNEFQHEVPSYWTRYSERFLEEILESTFTLIDASEFQSSSSVEQLITPLHYLSLLDPLATWFKKWTHGNYSRTEVVKQLKEHPKLLSDAVGAILDFPHTLKTAVTIPEILEDQDQQERQDSGSEDGMFYSVRDLEFLFFVHSLSIVGRLFIYNDGRGLFPIELPDRQETLTVTDLLVVLIKIMCIPMPKSMAKAGLDGTIVPGDLVSDVLQEIASNSEAIKECLCKDAITSTLLAPVQNILDGLPDLDSDEESDTESVLLLISDVLAALASTENGRLQLLYGESQERWQRSRFSPAHIIAGFSKKALSDSLCCPLSNDVIGGFLFVCRQLWTTSEGLIVLNQYALHEKVAQAWVNANELHSMSTTSLGEQDDSAEHETIQNAESLVWESSLLDNLLNFAGTPKGVLLLQLTGMMDQCIGYMYKRYTKKLQVSKCEKFGYGVMVCQFAATAPGIVALEKKGYLQRLIQDVWLVFEGLYDRRLQPIIKHIDTIDSRAYSKALNNLLSVFSAFPAVYEVLTVHNRPSTSTSEVEEIKPVEHELDAPVTFAELINRLIFIDSDSKISSLFNYEQSHHFGLRVLNVLCSCLDTLLFLESTYHFTELLLQAQLDNRLENGKDYIIDRCSIERNQILVKSYWVGGPSERILPGRDLTEDKSKPYPWPLFSSFPPPKDYVVQDYAVITNAFEEGDSILEFLEGEKPSKDESIEWLEKFRELFCKTIKSGGFKCKTKVLKLLLESVCHVLTNIPEESIFPLIEFSVGELSLKNTDLSSIESLGVKLVIRYGLQLKILQSKGDSTEDLQHLLKYAKFFMRSQQKVPDSTLRTLSVEYPGHDWFVSTIFLMFGGDPDESREFLFKFSSLVCSGYLWIRRLHASVHLPTSLTVSGIPPLYSCTCHNIELILQAEVPLVFSALRMSGYTPSQICQHWLRQCFWNYLPWDHVCLYVCVCLTLGIDYQVYFCIAIFKHLQQEILKSTQDQRLLVMLKEEPIRNFRLEDHLDFMIDLEKKYRLTILSDLQNITRP